MARIGVQAMMLKQSVEEIGAFFLWAGNEVLLLQDAHGDLRRFLLAHAVCSMVLSRPIMASTRART